MSAVQRARTAWLRVGPPSVLLCLTGGLPWLAFSACHECVCHIDRRVHGLRPRAGPHARRGGRHVQGPRGGQAGTGTCMYHYVSRSYITKVRWASEVSRLQPIAGLGGEEVSLRVLVPRQCWVQARRRGSIMENTLRVTLDELARYNESHACHCRPTRFLTAADRTTAGLLPYLNPTTPLLISHPSITSRGCRCRLAWWCLQCTPAVPRRVDPARQEQQGAQHAHGVREPAQKPLEGPGGWAVQQSRRCCHLFSADRALALTVISDAPVLRCIWTPHPRTVDSHVSA